MCPFPCGLETVQSGFTSSPSDPKGFALDHLELPCWLCPAPGLATELFRHSLDEGVSRQGVDKWTEVGMSEGRSAPTSMAAEQLSEWTGVQVH